VITKRSRGRQADLLDRLLAEVEERRRPRPAPGTDPLNLFSAFWASHNPKGTLPHKVKIGTRSEWADKITDLPPKARRQIWSWVPPLDWYDLILVNTSAGKDSAATLSVINRLVTERGLRDKVWVVHCDLGRVEHPGTMELAVEHARTVDLPIKIVERTVRGEKIGLLDRFRSRLEAGGGFPGFGTRYCTSEFKTGEVAKLVTSWVTGRFGAGDLVAKMGRRARVLNVLGLRAEESEKRQGPPFTLKRENQTRVVVHEWLPIQGWTEPQVWAEHDRAGLRRHPFYAKGGRRLSCRFCPLAADSDLRLAGREYPELAKEYIALEAEFGVPFKERRKLSDILGAKNDCPVHGSQAELPFAPRALRYPLVVGHYVWPQGAPAEWVWVEQSSTGGYDVVVHVDSPGAVPQGIHHWTYLHPDGALEAAMDLVTQSDGVLVSGFRKR